MSNLENITQKILEDAKQKALEIEADANQQIDDIFKSREDEARAVKDKIVERAKANAVQIKDKIIAGANLKSRDQQLLAKQRVMDRVFELAKEALKTLDDSKYSEFVEDRLKDLKLKGTEVLIPQAGKEGLLKSISKGIKLSDSEKLDSGFAILDGKTVMNFNFNDLVDFNRLDLEGEIAKRLFAEEE